MKRTYRGAPLLPAAPFAAWLATRPEPTTRIAAALGVNERRIRSVLESAQVSELLVERAGLALAGDPRLAAQLYPDLDW